MSDLPEIDRDTRTEIESQVYRQPAPKSSPRCTASSLIICGSIRKSRIST